MFQRELENAQLENAQLRAEVERKRSVTRRDSDAQGMQSMVWFTAWMTIS